MWRSHSAKYSSLNAPPSLPLIPGTVIGWCFLSRYACHSLSKRHSEYCEITCSRGLRAKVSVKLAAGSSARQSSRTWLSRCEPWQDTFERPSAFSGHVPAASSSWHSESTAVFGMCITTGAPRLVDVCESGSACAAAGCGSAKSDRCCCQRRRASVA